MAQLIVLYGHPDDPEAFDRHYAQTHAPLAEQIPNCRSFTWGHVTTPDGSAPEYYLSAVLGFDSVAALQTALGTAEGRAAAADVPGFATGGATMLVQED